LDGANINRTFLGIKQLKSNLPRESRDQPHCLITMDEGCEEIDQVIDLPGHIIGTGLSPDHRFEPMIYL